MIKAAIDKILGLAAPSLVRMDGGREYSNQPLHAMKEPMPEPLTIHTLTGLVDYVAAHKDMLSDLDGEKPFFQVPNPVTLRPYRTFMEVEQPAISCVFRLRQGPMLSLHEADGGLWRLEAIKSIKAYLVQAMVDLGQNIPVIA